MKDTRQIDLNHNIHKFAGFVRCGDCGRAMVKVCRHSDGKYDLICSTYSRIGKSVCTQHKIRYNELEEIVLEQIQSLISEMANIEEIIQESKNLVKSSKLNELYKKQIAALGQQMNRAITLKKGIYEDYKEGILTKQEYLQYKDGYEKDEQRYKNQIDTLELSNRGTNEKLMTSQWYQAFKEHHNIQSLDRGVLAELIDHIDIYEENHIAIVFKFMDNKKAWLEDIL